MAILWSVIFIPVGTDARAARRLIVLNLRASRAMLVEAESPAECGGIDRREHARRLPGDAGDGVHDTDGLRTTW